MHYNLGSFDRDFTVRRCRLVDQPLSDFIAVGHLKWERRASVWGIMNVVVKRVLLKLF